MNLTESESIYINRVLKIARKLKILIKFKPVNDMIYIKHDSLDDIELNYEKKFKVRMPCGLYPRIIEVPQ